MNEKRGKRSSWYDPVTRYWFKWNGKIYRFLNWSNVEPCFYGGEPKEFYMRLPNNDPRPRGVHMSGLSDNLKEFYALFPEKQWIEIIMGIPQ
jgi:hypothetical protein